VAFRECEPNRALQHVAWRQEFAEKIQAGISRAIDPVKYKATEQPEEDEPYSQPLGQLKPVRLEVYRGVPWGNVIHLFPSRILKVVLQARDILRLDLLTLAGVVSFIVTIVRDVDDIFVKASALGTIAVYIARIGFTFRRVLSTTRFQVSVGRCPKSLAWMMPRSHSSRRWLLTSSTPSRHRTTWPASCRTRRSPAAMWLRGRSS
jgi:hypothetical protein